MELQDYQNIRKHLFSLGEDKYREFTKKLTPTKYEIIGIRVPQLRKLAKEIEKKYQTNYLDLVDYTYLEEVMIAFLILANIDDEEVFDKYFAKMKYYIDNWEICDIFCNSFQLPKINYSKYLKMALDLLNSEDEFIVRCGLIIILNHYIKEENLEKIFKKIEEIKVDKYYTNMGIAWLLCEIYISYPLQTEEYFQKTKINDFTMNKTISKIKESYRIDNESKKYLDRYKRKRK